MTYLKSKRSRLLLMIVLLFAAQLSSCHRQDGCPDGTHNDGNGNCPKNVLIEVAPLYSI